MKYVDLLSYAVIVTVLAGSVWIGSLLRSRSSCQAHLLECRQFRAHAARILLGD
jgi:hypothetical protein